MNVSADRFGVWLKQLRIQRGLTQETLAELANCSVQTIRFFETSKRRPSLAMAEHLATIFALPSAEVEPFVQLARQALAQTEEAPAAAFSPPATPDPIPSTLPPLEQPLIGRAAECTILRQLLVQERRRLVTLIGAGGMGKSHLALALATELAPTFADGAVFVAIAPLRAAAHLPSAIATALHLTLGAGDPGELVLTLLAERQLLLVLDGFEELLHQDEGAAATWISHLLQRADQVQILVTSRERLRLSGERTFELGGLALPVAGAKLAAADAVLLFLERAQQAAPDFRLDSQNQDAVARICQLVDGMPLGIELAAAWVRVLTPAEIAEELARNVDFLARANRDAAPRHRSMRAIFEHSWALLDGKEQEVLGRLAVFRGGCYREAAQAVAGATLPLLAGLIDKSLVRRQQTATHARYELHEVVRQFAAEKRREAQRTPPSPQAPPAYLAQDDAWLAHYTYFYKLAATAKAHLQGREQLHWLRLLDEELANLRAALERCLATQDFGRGCQLALQLEEYWYIRGYHREGLQRLREFLQPGRAVHGVAALANGYAAAAILAIAGGDYRTAEGYLAQSLDDVRQWGTQAELARTLRYRGLVALHEGDYAAAERYAGEAVAVATASHNHYEAATSLSHLAEIALLGHNYARAQALGEQAVGMLRLIEDKNQLAGSLRRLAQARIQQGELGAAQHDALESLLLNSEVGDRRGTAASIVMLALLLATTNCWEGVAQLLGAADALLTQAQSSLLPADQEVYTAIREQAMAHAAVFSAAYATGRGQMAQQTAMPYNLAWIQEWFV